MLSHGGAIEWSWLPSVLWFWAIAAFRMLRNFTFFGRLKSCFHTWKLKISSESWRPKRPKRCFSCFGVHYTNSQSQRIKTESLRAIKEQTTLLLVVFSKMIDIEWYRYLPLFSFYSLVVLAGDRWRKWKLQQYQWGTLRLLILTCAFVISHVAFQSILCSNTSGVAVVALLVLLLSEMTSQVMFQGYFWFLPLCIVTLPLLFRCFSVIEGMTARRSHCI